MKERQKNLCVFLASRSGIEPKWTQIAREFAQKLASHGYRLVYGGASVGLMGTLADAALEAGAEVYGSIPQCLVDYEVAHEGLTRQTIVDSMHKRKQLMAAWSDAFVLLPGGVGSLEEIFEMITWKQLKMVTAVAAGPPPPLPRTQPRCPRSAPRRLRPQARLMQARLMQARLISCRLA